MTDTTTVAVIDDHPLFREGVVRSLAGDPGFQVVAEGCSSQDAIRIAQDLAPDLLLIDLSMPGGGLSAIQPIRRSSPKTRIVVLTVSESAEDLAAALNHGARGYLLKGIGSRALAEILTTITAGESYVTPSLSARLLTHVSNRLSSNSESTPARSLSTREMEVLELLAEGKSNKEIALRLDLQEKTVKHHVSHILSKLGASNRTEAAIRYHGMKRPVGGVSEALVP